MIIEDTEALRTWLTSFLEPLCDADPQALAKYVMALIKKDKPERELKNSCLDQLEVFLQNSTISFVDTLFETIANQSYLKPLTSSVPTTATSTPTTSVEKTSSQTSVPAVSGQSDTSSSVVNKSSDELANIKSSEQQITGNNKSDSTHESASKARDNKRNRSRSRSRSPLRNTRRNDFDRRLGPTSNRNNGNNYFNDDRRNRRGVANSRRAGNQRFGGSGYRNERDYRRQRDLKRGRSRSRSRSFSSASRSRSRSRSWSRDRESPNTKKSRPTSRPTSRSPSPSKTTLKDKELSKKCRDYEEKGFCLNGHLCPYDHGNDPVVLDSNVSAALGFGNNPSANAAPMMPPMPNTGIPPYAPEPYNPESPGMDSHPNIRPPMGPRMPPPPHFWGPMGPMRGHMSGGPPLPPHQFIPPPGRPRELIGVPTIDNNHNRHHNHSISNRTVIEPNIHMGHRGAMRGGMGKHMGRGGYRNVRRVTNDTSDKTCLEVRKIPSNRNTISHLNQHFSKFGTIVNLQVCHDSDPEAALVQYTSHPEALAAIRSTEAVLNNRFIKVFWHSKEQQIQHDDRFGVRNDTTESTDASDEQSVPQKGSVKDRLGPKVSETESVLTAVNSSGTISRTVFDPSKLKKNNTNNQMKDNSNETNSGQSVDTLALKSKSAANEKTNKRQQNLIYTKQLSLMKELIEQQKHLTEKLENCTNDNEKKFYKETMDNIYVKIQELSKQMKSTVSQKKSLTKRPRTKSEIMEEILNTELDMMVEKDNPKDYFELYRKRAKLKKSLTTRGRGSVRAFPRRSRGAVRRGSFYGRGANPLLKVDRRTRKLLIPDINEDDITDLLEHLAQFSDVEVIEPSSNGAVVTFKTRVDAEKAIQNMTQTKFKENFQLNYSWFDENIRQLSDKHSLAKPMTESKCESDANDREMETLAEDQLDFEEDDTEDESEARNWKA